MRALCPRRSALFIVGLDTVDGYLLAIGGYLTISCHKTTYFSDIIITIKLLGTELNWFGAFLFSKISREGRLSVVWNQIKAEYIAGGTSYRKLAEKYNVSESKLKKIAAKEHWSELRNQSRTKLDRKITETIAKAQVSRLERINNVADVLLARIEVVANNPNLDVMPPATITELTKALKNVKEIQSVKSDLDVREQEARIRALEEQTKKNKEIPEIKVVFGDGEGLAQ